MTWACFQASSSALPSMVMGPRAQRHSNSVGGALKAGAGCFDAPPCPPTFARPKAATTASAAVRLMRMVQTFGRRVIMAESARAESRVEREYRVRYAAHSTRFPWIRIPSRGSFRPSGDCESGGMGIALTDGDGLWQPTFYLLP